MARHVYGNPACGPDACLSLPAIWPANGTRACCGRRYFPAHAGGQDSSASRTQIGDIVCDECFCEAMAPSSTSSDDSAPALAVLMLGHRERLVFTSIPDYVVAPSVQHGYAVTFFAILEAGPMRRPWALPRAVMANPLHGKLSDTDLAARLSAAVRSAGGTVGSIDIGSQVLGVPATAIRAPRTAWARLRMYSYPHAVVDTVAVCLRKEQLGYEALTRYERTARMRHRWVLLLREDSHWLMPLQLGRFEPGFVHGKDCNTWGGWNDLLWLIPREHAAPMLNMYDDLHQAHPYLRCWLRGAAGKLTGFLERDAYPDGSRGVAADATSEEPAVLLDALVSQGSEQWRARVGRLRRIPYRESTRTTLPATVARLTPMGGVCYIPLYSDGCVPSRNTSHVAAHTCPSDGWKHAAKPKAWADEVQPPGEDEVAPAGDEAPESASLPPLPTRTAVALALAGASQAGGALAAFRIRIGLAGVINEQGRNSVQSSYVRALIRSRIVVTCSPDGWEGDSRLGEALASGALVLSDALVAPPPGLKHGRQLLFYSSTQHMLRLAAWALRRPERAAAIAREGAAYVASHLTPAAVVDGVVDVLQDRRQLSRDAHGRVRLHVAPVQERCRIGAYVTLIHGLEKSERVVQVAPHLATVLVLPLWDMFCDAGESPTATHSDAVDQRVRELAGEVDSTVAVVALDYADAPTLLVHDSRIDFYFKRSRVHRLARALMPYDREVWPLHYAVRTGLRTALQEAKGEEPQRDIDLSCFLKANEPQGTDVTVAAAAAASKPPASESPATVFTSKVFVTPPILSEGEAPRVLIHCPQNAGCTAFALYLCELLDAACRPDTDCNEVPVWNVPRDVAYVHKATLSGTGEPDNPQTSRSIKFTHRILLFRDPVQNYLSLARKNWCNECGGFESKWRTTDTWFRAHYLRDPAGSVLRQEWPYNAVVFVEELGQPARLERLLRSIGLVPKHGSYASAMRLRHAGNISRIAQHNWDVAGIRMNANDVFQASGNFRPRAEGAGVPEVRPHYCTVAETMRRYTPSLFATYHSPRRPHGRWSPPPTCVSERASQKYSLYCT